MKNKVLRIISLLLCLVLLAPLVASCGTENEAETESTFESESETEKVTETEKASESAPETETEAEPEAETETETETGVETETEAETTKEIIHVDSLELDTYSVTVKAGESSMPLVTMKPDNADDKSELWSSDNTSVAKVNSYGNITGVSAGKCTVTVRSSDNRELYKNVEVTVEPAPEPETTAAPKNEAPASASSPTYIGGILIANKTYALPSDYNPGVDPTAYAALSEMFSAASAEGISLWVASGFRSYSTQRTLYNNYVAQDGKAAADTYSARPGHSEHQTGLAFDLNYVSDWFANTKEGQWLAANCWKYGFIIRYPAGKEWATGYKYEPWHVRYLGKDAAKAVYNSGLSLEEYLGITSQYNY